MLIPLLLGCATVVITMGIQITALGYGDIVTSDQWRLLGALEASNGVLMFGLSAGAMLSVMSYMLTYDNRLKNQLAELERHRQDHR